MKKKKQYYSSIPPSDREELPSIIVGAILSLAFMAAIGYGLYNLISAL